jgi:hypothetical protein
MIQIGHICKTVLITFGFVGLWFGPNMKEVGKELCSIGRRVGLWVCGHVVWPKYDTHAKTFYKTWACGLVV